MAMTLVLCGMLALVGISIATVAGQQAGQASIVRVYLASDATPSAIAALESRLRADPRVRTVTEVSAEQALQEAQSKPGWARWPGLTGSNPFSASLDVQVQTGGTGGGASRQRWLATPRWTPRIPRRTTLTPTTACATIALVIGGIGAGLLLLFALVAYAVAANSMRAIAAARHNEVTVTRLLGARGWMVRGPFVTEGLVTGALAGALAAAAVLVVWTLAYEPGVAHLLR